MAQKEDLFQQIEAVTPALRRYARALCSGAGAAFADDLVQTAIERAAVQIHSKELRAGDRDAARLGAYHALTALARDRLRAAGAMRPSSRQPAIAQGLADLPFEERASLLLVALEGLSYDAAARAAGAPREALLTRLMRARAGLASLDLRPQAPSAGARRVGGHLRLVK
jgi:DNA-directed RNA polymerase specialized sigma24 family protein